MNRVLRYLLLVLLALLLDGCCTTYDLVTNSKKEFERSRNREIGDPIEKHFPQQFVQIIKEWEGPYGDNIVVTRNKNGTVTYTEPMTDSKQCFVSRVIDEEGWIIRSWTYADGNDDCRADDSYCGP